MRLTIDHVHFWTRHRAPAVLQAVIPAQSGPRRPDLIHACINAHASVHVRADNTVMLLRMHRRSTPGSLLAYLIELGAMGWSFHNAPRRSAWCRKWARRIALQTYGDNAETCRHLAAAEATSQYRAGRSAAAYVPKE